MTAEESLWDKEKIQHRYLRITKLFFLLISIYLLWISVILIGTYFLQLEYKWAVLTIEQWILSAIFLICIVIGFEFIILLIYFISKKRHLTPKHKKVKFIQGKKVYSYTLPITAKGGIFSKTYIMIDEKRVLNLRYQMIPPQDLWGKNQ